jgi:hypothetical protein
VGNRFFVGGAKVRSSMAKIVLIHGVAQENGSADILEVEWLPALAGGIRNAGFASLADLIWRGRGGLGDIETRMAFYGHVFHRPNSHDSSRDTLSPQQAAIAEGLALEWLERAAERSTGEADRRIAAGRLSFVRSQINQPSRGAKAVARPAVIALAHLNCIAQVGAGIAERFVVRALNQVARYLTEDSIREVARQSVLEVLGPETRVVIAHSLGSIVAYEAVHTLAHPLPLLITLGAPLGADAIVLHRLHPHASFPQLVRRWLNIADADDIVAGDADLTSLFSAGKPESACLECETSDSGSDPHSARFYLGRAAVGHAVASALSDTSPGEEGRLAQSQLMAAQSSKWGSKPW